jgi:hypothetical protein
MKPSIGRVSKVVRQPTLPGTQLVPLHVELYASADAGHHSLHAESQNFLLFWSYPEPPREFEYQPDLAGIFWRSDPLRDEPRRGDRPGGDPVRGDRLRDA